MAPTFRHGKGSRLYLSTGGSTSGAVLMSSGLDTQDFERSVETAETSVYTVGDKTYLPGLRDATISGAGNFSSTHEAVVTGLLGSTAGYFVFGPEGNSTGRRRYKGACVVTGLKLSSPLGDRASMEFTLQCSGAITSTVF